MSRCLVAVLSVALAISQPGCTTTMVSVGRQPDRVAQSVEVGDYIIVNTISGEQYGFEVTELTPLAISGPVREISFDDIASVEVGKLRPWEPESAMGWVGGFFLTLGLGVLMLGALVRNSDAGD